MGAGGRVDRRDCGHVLDHGRWRLVRRGSWRDPLDDRRWCQSQFCEESSPSQEDVERTILHRVTMRHDDDLVGILHCGRTVRYHHARGPGLPAGLSTRETNAGLVSSRIEIFVRRISALACSRFDAVHPRAPRTPTRHLRNDARFLSCSPPSAQGARLGRADGQRVQGSGT